MKLVVITSLTNLEGRSVCLVPAKIGRFFCIVLSPHPHVYGNGLYSMSVEREEVRMCLEHCHISSRACWDLLNLVGRLQRIQSEQMQCLLSFSLQCVAQNSMGAGFSLSDLLAAEDSCLLGALVPLP